MELNAFFKEIIDGDLCPVVVTDLTNTILYMNPAAISRYEAMGGASLVGRNLSLCHKQASNERIAMVLEWFRKDKNNNRIFTHHNDRDNRDIYMVAIRDENGELIGFYEKHEPRTLEAGGRYHMGGNK